MRGDVSSFRIGTCVRSPNGCDETNSASCDESQKGRSALTLRQAGEKRDLRQLLWHRHRLVQARTRIMNQLQAVALDMPELTHPAYPLSTLHWVPRGSSARLEAETDRYSFLVRLLHPLLHAGLPGHSVTGIFAN